MNDDDLILEKKVLAFRKKYDLKRSYDDLVHQKTTQVYERKSELYHKFTESMRVSAKDLFLFGAPVSLLGTVFLRSYWTIPITFGTVYYCLKKKYISYYGKPEELPISERLPYPGTPS